MKYTIADLLEFVPLEKRDEFMCTYNMMHGIKGIETERVLANVCQTFEVPAEKLKSKNRHGDVAFARQVYFTTMRICSTKSYESIARTMNKDHSTVIYSMSVVKGDYQNNPMRRETIRKFISGLNKTEQKLMMNYLDERNPDTISRYSSGD